MKGPGDKSTRDRTLPNLLKSPSSIFPASGVSRTIILSFDPSELCDRKKILLQEKRNNSDIINEEDIIIIDKLLEYKRMSKKQHRQLLIKCNLLLK